MIVNRWTFSMVGERADEAFALFKAEMIRANPSRRMRFYSANIAPVFAFSWEAEYENMAEFEKARTERYAAMDPEFVKKLLALARWESGGVNEIWNLK